MGRMLETLKHGESRRSLLTVSKPVDEMPVQDCVVDWEIAEEVPYVEVGAPGKKVELSPGLMKHAPQAAPQPPHLPIEIAPAAPKPSAVNLTQLLPMTVAFEPWSDPAPLPIGVSPDIIAYHQPEHAATKEYSRLLEALRGGLKADSANVLLLIGVKPHVGTSTVLLNLATLGALQQKLRVAVVEANGKRAGLAQRLGHTATPGLQDVIEGTLALEHAVVKTAIPLLHLLPAGASVKKLTNDAMTWLIGWLRARYDLIFIDGPTMEDADAIAAPVSHADAIYLVLPKDETASVGKGVAQSINRMGGRLGGLIHTHFEM